MNTILIPIIIVVSMGLIAGIILTILSKVLYVPVDEKQIAIRDELPGANCGACGFAGCDDYASALAKDPSIAPNLCTPGGASVAQAVAGIMGVEAGSADKKVAIVKCNGNFQVTDTIMTYNGVQTCKAAKQFYGGNWACTQGCLGLGDCKEVCDYGAITIQDGLAVIDRELCVACGKCEKVCPNHVISMSSAKNLVYVSCNSTAQGAKTRKACTVGCIGCGKCVKVCKFDAISVENNLAKVDFEKCKNCGLCVKECPTNAIVNLRKPSAPKKPAQKPAEKKDEAPKVEVANEQPSKASEE